MTFHLEGPWLTTAGKKKTKTKFRSANEARTARQLAQSWDKLKDDWGVTSASQASRTIPLVYTLDAPPGRTTARIQSRDTGHIGAVCSKEIPRYTGDHVMGIAQMPKSNAVPVFKRQDIVDIGKMRRG